MWQIAAPLGWMWVVHASSIITQILPSNILVIWLGEVADVILGRRSRARGAGWA